MEPGWVKPSIVTGWVIVRGAVRLMGCQTPGIWNLTVSLPYIPAATTSALTLRLLLADAMASRRVTLLSTAIVSPHPVTVMVAGTRRFSRISSHGRDRRTSDR